MVDDLEERLISLPADLDAAVAADLARGLAQRWAERGSTTLTRFCSTSIT